ncbi:transmembrane protein 232 [Megalops cyprinoides]|uniref:transmembrane protein 232 n=1 Tax=Megalops cyprinoides TaxID=118141 RepID=UPI0018644A6D|nr:transmembrane protein 232 [Megalops cyprinoides]
MPIFKIPVVHNLAIISNVHRTDLKKRLFKKEEERDACRSVKASTSRNPFEINEEFVEKFNHAQGSVDQEKYVHLAEQLLCRTKRRAGLRCLGEGDHVELPLAWRGLMFLALCRGKIQNDALDCLLKSLDQAPVQAEQLPVLFHLGESVLSWVCADSAQRPSLHTCDVKMLQVGYLVFLRLFLSYISGNLSGYHASKSRLHHFLKVLAQYELCYQPYPDMLFVVNFILRTGEMICGFRPTDNDPALFHADLQGRCLDQVLWHCLLSWYCVQNNHRQLSQTLRHLVLLRDELLLDRWLTCGLGLMVLGEAAKSSLLCLHVLLDLSVNYKQNNNGLEPDREVMSQKRSWPWQLEHIYTTVIADICQHGCSAEIRKTALVGKQAFTGQNTFNAGGLLSLLKHNHREDWRMRYSAVQALMKLCGGIRGDLSREGLRNAAWTALQEHLGRETDPRVKEAVRVTEVESSGSKNVPSRARVKIETRCQEARVPKHLIAWRLAFTLSQLYLPPTPHQLLPSDKLTKEVSPPARTKQEIPTPLKPSKGKCPPTRTKHLPYKQTATHNTPRQENLGKAVKHGLSIDFRIRAQFNLMKVVEEQWQKELQRKMAAEEEAERGDIERQRRREEETFKEILRNRMEKVKKDTKPYEL